MHGLHYTRFTQSRRKGGDEKVWQDEVMVFEISGKLFALIVLESLMILLARPALVVDGLIYQKS